MAFDYQSNINLIDDYYKSVLTIKEEYFAALENAKKKLYREIIKNNSAKLDPNDIKLIFQECTNKTDELVKDSITINKKKNDLATYKFQLGNQLFSEGFDTMSPQIMARDTVTLYNLQYLQIFCKVLGIIIIIAIFWKYFSSITGMTSLPSIIPQAASFPQAALPEVSIPQAAST